MTEHENPFPGQVLAKVDLGPEYSGLEIIGGVPLESANVITSEMCGHPDMHRPVLDIDVPVKVVPSSTEGHYHLFIDCPMSWGQYVALLDVLTDAGIIEPGYQGASEARGFTAVRLPWIKKPVEKVTAEGETAAILADPFAMDAIAEAQAETAA